MDPSASQPLQPGVIPPVMPQPAPPAGAAPMSAPVAAQDSDVIEAEWIDRVEQINRQYKDDPYQQTEALHALKLEYLKKRFNKDINTSSA